VALAALLTAPHTFGIPAVAAAGLVVLLPSWLLLAVLHGGGPSGPGVALTALAVVWAADVGAYGVGRRFGRVKLAPKISPGKTWEGLGGGVALAAAAAWVAEHPAPTAAEPSTAADGDGGSEVEPSPLER
jgi:CDP-diglyceride synthetase